jgi:hypothetical protein
VPVARTRRGVTDGRDEFLDKAIEVVSRLATRTTDDGTKGDDQDVAEVVAVAECRMP